MKWDFFYDKNEGAKYHSFAYWNQQTHHLYWALITSLILIVFEFILFSIFPIS